jgi:hypothetical protein
MRSSRAAPAGKLYWQLRDASLLAREHALNRAGDAVFGDPGEQRLKGDPRLQPGQGRTDAEVDPLSEG